MSKTEVEVMLRVLRKMEVDQVLGNVKNGKQSGRSTRIDFIFRGYFSYDDFVKRVSYS